MTKQRHCFVTQVGDAIEALASALDPERKPPFSGDILDLLEWAEKDVRAMRSEIERLKTVPMRYRRMAFNAQLQDENAQLSQQLAEYKGSYENACNLVARMHAAAVGEVTGPRRGVVEDVEDLRQQLTERDAEVAKANKARQLAREEIIAAAKECGAYRYTNRAAKNEPTHTFTISQLERFYTIAFEDGAASRDAEIGMLLTYLEYIANGELGPKICAALAKDALAKVRKP